MRQVIRLYRTVKTLAGSERMTSVVRYVFFGGLTTLVNLSSFYLFRRVLYMELQTANVLSIVTAILFAYVVNAKYVFRERYGSLREHLPPFFRFLGARGVTMVIEVVGVWLLIPVLGLPDMWGKFLVQFLVLVLNYLFSRYIVFKKSL